MYTTALAVGGFALLAVVALRVPTIEASDRDQTSRAEHGQGAGGGNDNTRVGLTRHELVFVQARVTGAYDRLAHRGHHLLAKEPLLANDEVHWTQALALGLANRLFRRELGHDHRH